MNIYYKLFLICAILTVIFFVLLASTNIEVFIWPTGCFGVLMIVFSVASEFKLLSDLRKIIQDLKDERDRDK